MPSHNPYRQAIFENTPWIVRVLLQGFLIKGVMRFTMDHGMGMDYHLQPKTNFIAVGKW